MAKYEYDIATLVGRGFTVGPLQHRPSFDPTQGHWYECYRQVYLNQHSVTAQIVLVHVDYINTSVGWVSSEQDCVLLGQPDRVVG